MSSIHKGTALFILYGRLLEPCGEADLGFCFTSLPSLSCISFISIYDLEEVLDEYFIFHQEVVHDASLLVC